MDPWSKQHGSTFKRRRLHSLLDRPLMARRPILTDLNLNGCRKADLFSHDNDYKKSKVHGLATRKVIKKYS